MTDVLELAQVFSETLARVRARLDADANGGLTEDNPAWIDLREGSFYWDCTQPPAMEMARLWDALTEAVAAAFPTTAWGEYLDEHGATFGLTRNVAVRATGTLTFSASEPTPIAVGTMASSVATQTGESISYATTESGTTSALLDVPTNVAAVPEEGGGSLRAGTRYYHVSALNLYGETPASKDTAASRAVTMGNAGRNFVYWNPVAGAANYRVYVSQTANTPGELLGSTVATSFVDDGTVVASGPEPKRNTTSGITLSAQAVLAGFAGNTTVGAITSLDTVIGAVVGVTNIDRFQGGAEAESDNDFRQRILTEYLGARGGGTVADYRRWALGQGAERVAVIPVWDGPGTVLVVLMQTDGSPVDRLLVERVQNFLDPIPGRGEGQAPIGAAVTVLTSRILDVDITGYVTPRVGFSLEGGGNTVPVRGLIVTALNTYLRGLDPGDRIVHEHIEACFFVPGVHTISSVTVNGTTSGEIPLSAGSAPQVARLRAVRLTEL